MSITITRYESAKLLRMLHVAYQDPAQRICLDSAIARMSYDSVRTGLTKSLSTGVEDLHASGHSLLPLAMTVCTAVTTLTEDQEDYTGSLVIPWVLKGGLLTASNGPRHMLLPWEMVGELSESVIHCSYNDDDVRLPWSEGRLNEWILGYKPLSSQGPDFLSSYAVKDKDYQSLLTFLVKQFGYWPDDWGHRNPSLPTNLTEKELDMLDAFDDVLYVANMYAT